MGLLYGILDNDSRAKRAFEALADGNDFTAFVLSSKNPENFPYPVVKSPFSSRSRIMGVLWICLAFYKLAKNKTEIVYAEGLLTLVPACFYKMIFKAKIVYDSRELVLQDADKKSIYSDFHRIVEKTFIQFADVVFTANEQRAEFLSSHYRLKNKVVSLLNIPPVKKGIRAKSLKPNSDSNNKPLVKTVVYQGRVNTLRGLDRILEAFKNLGNDVRLLLIVEGRAIGELKTLIKEFGLEGRTEIRSFMPHDDLYKVLHACDLGIVSYEMQGLNNIYCAPNKLFEYAQCNLPMITSPQPIFRELFNEYRIGFHFDPADWASDNIQGLSRSIRAAIDYKFLESDFDRFNQNYQWERESAKVKNVLEIFNPKDGGKEVGSKSFAITK